MKHSKKLDDRLYYNVRYKASKAKKLNDHLYYNVRYEASKETQ